MGCDDAGKHDPFKDVPMNNDDSWRKVQQLAKSAIFKCGHPRGGCPTHCDIFARFLEIANARLDAGAAFAQGSPATPCQHPRNCGPMGVIIGKSVGSWRVLLCETCHAYKMWLDGDEQPEDWIFPRVVAAQSERPGPQEEK
jgi:hypothetical protein